jgi:hypothetical protein
MRNYMKKRVLEEGYKPRYYIGDKRITGDHVARFYGACLGKMLSGGRSITQIFCTREIFDAVPSIQAAMTKSALKDLTACLHYSDDWDPKDDDRVWDDIYKDPKVVADEGTAPHRLKHGRLEDGYNKVCTVVCCCCCYFFESISKLHSPILSYPILLCSGGKLLLTLENGSQLMRVKWQAGIIAS